MGSPTRYKNGVTNVGASDPMRMLQVPDPSLMHMYFNDFDHYVAGDWTVTVIGTTPAQALADEDGGVITITNSAADNDSLQAQKKGESFLLAAGKKAMFKARFKLSDATQSDFLIGLAITDTVLLDTTSGGADGFTDGITFVKNDGVATLDVYCQKDATTGQTSTSGIATLVDATYVTVAWYYDGTGNLEYYVNNAHKGTLNASSTYLPDTELTVSYALANGAAAAKTASIDYILAAIER
jgi:hypothetical protein